MQYVQALAMLPVAFAAPAAQLGAIPAVPSAVIATINTGVSINTQVSSVVVVSVPTAPSVTLLTVSTPGVTIATPAVAAPSIPVIATPALSLGAPAGTASAVAILPSDCASGSALPAIPGLSGLSGSGSLTGLLPNGDALTGLTGTLFSALAGLSAAPSLSSGCSGVLPGLISSFISGITDLTNVGLSGSQDSGTVTGINGLPASLMADCGADMPAGTLAGLGGFGSGSAAGYLPAVGVPTVPELSAPSVSLPALVAPTVAVPVIATPSVSLVVPAVAAPTLDEPTLSTPSPSATVTVGAGAGIARRHKNN